MAKIKYSADGYYHTREYGHDKPRKKERRNYDEAEKEFEVCKLCREKNCKGSKKCIERHREQFIREGRLPVSSGTSREG